jgi:hypothetical protein
MTMQTTAGEQLAEHYRLSALREIADHAAMAGRTMRDCAACVGPEYGCEKAAHEDDAAAFEALAKALEAFTQRQPAIDYGALDQF